MAKRLVNKTISDDIIPVKPFLLGSPQTAAAAGKEGPVFFVLLLFSFWLCRLHSPVDTPLHKGLEKNNNRWSLIVSNEFSGACEITFRKDYHTHLAVP